MATHTSFDYENNWCSESTIGFHQFIIRGYSTLKARASKYYKESSDIFTVGGYKWGICFYPNRDTSGNHSSGSSVYLGFVNGPTVTVRVSFEIKILDQSGKGNHIVFGCNRVLTKLEVKARFAGFDALNICDCVKDDCIVIQCVIGVSSRIAVKHKLSDQTESIGKNSKCTELSLSRVSKTEHQQIAAKRKLSNQAVNTSKNSECSELKPESGEKDRTSAKNVSERQQ